MTNYFEVSDILDKNLPQTQDIINKAQYHIDILNPIRALLKIPIVIKPRIEELDTIDVSCHTLFLQELFEALQRSPYTRVCLYPKQKFIRCDFKPVGEKQIFMCFDGKTWERIQD